VNKASLWNSLETVQVAVSILTPLAIAILGIIVTRAAKQAEARAVDAARAAENAQWANRRAVERLIELHKEMAPLLNDLMCFFGMIGHFREIDPPDAIARKRQLDRIFFVNEHLFGSRFREKYQLFMSKCFAHWQGPGQEARLKASADRLRIQRGSTASWDDSWDRMFEEIPDSREQRHEQRTIYDEAMSAFAAELGLSQADRSGPS
jgi:hypothetical protein